MVEDNKIMDTKTETKKALNSLLEKYTIAEFSRRHGIPYRTVQDWKNGNRTPPEWVIKLLVKIESD